MCILFVEDELLITMAAEDTLQDAGYEVMTADNAMAAIQMMADYPGHFTCVVTDLYMLGDMTGLGLYEHVRERYPMLPILLSTGRLASIPKEWNDQHQAEMLEKPYSFKLLASTVDRLISTAQGVFGASDKPA